MKKMKTVKPEEVTNSDPKQQAFQLNMQYLKELSFESPGSPFVLAQNKQYRADLNFNVETKKLENNSHEVALHVTAKSIDEDKPIFMIDIVYAGVFTIPEVAEDQRELMLFVVAPNLLFPFVRNMLFDMVRDGGFPPLMLNPIDFMAMYKQRQENAKKQN